MRIAFHIDSRWGWNAGRVYLETLFQTLRASENHKPEITIIGRAGDVSNIPDLCRIADDAITYPVADRWSRAWAVGAFGRRLLHRDLVGERFLKHHQISAILFGESPAGSKIPSIGWIPDFQHRHFPKFFGPKECSQRDEAFARTIELSAKVIVISESTKRDLETFYPQPAGKAAVLRPITVIPASVFEHSPESICERYHLPARFFYLPNQFWKHKNHFAVFTALSILKRKGLSVRVVCTGAPGDYRNPTFFSELLSEISRLGIRDEVIMLGMVPRDHVFQLMRHSVAVLNPSLFEGFGLSVDEACSLGKRLIVSDIPAHREQTPARALYFDPQNAEELAQEIEKVWSAADERGPNYKAESIYRDQLPTVMAQYAASFMNIVAEAVK